MKRLIICCDGTWQSSNHGLHNTPSNVTKISRSIAKYETRPDGSVVHQVVWYDAGVGTDTETDTGRIGMFAKQRKGAFGIGLEENVCEGYNFLVSLMFMISPAPLTGYRSTTTTLETKSTSLASPEVHILPELLLDLFVALVSAQTT